MTAPIFQAEYARHRGCSKDAVSKAITQGRLCALTVLVDGKMKIPPGGDPNFDADSSGAGARFNSVSCNIGCHSQPAIGGTSPATNQSFFSAHYRGATNTVPFFETIDGPTAKSVSRAPRRRSARS
jgi:hypothetical protein